MAEFSQGLLAGFQFVEGLADRRERRRIADEELGLRRAANSRAEEAFKTQQGVIEQAQLRQRQTDASSVALARAQSRGLENLEPFELAELEEQAAYNPQIATALTEMRLGRRDTESLQAIAPLARRGLGNVVTEATAPQAAAAPVNDGSLSPMDVVTQGADTELPPPQGTAPPGFFDRLRGREAGLKYENAEAFAQMYPGVQAWDNDTGSIPLPANFMTAEEMADKPMVERQAIIDRQRSAMGDGNYKPAIAASRQQQLAGEDAVTSWGRFVDQADEGGADLRRLAAEDPLAAALEFAGDYNTLNTMDPNRLAIVSREMAPVVNRATVAASARVRALPVQPNGRIANSPETRAAMNDFNQVLALQQQISDEFKPALNAAIRRGSMPVGNAELAAGVRQIVDSTPAPSQPESGSQLQANNTMARRAVASVQGGGRNLTTKQVESLAWLAKRGYITPDGFEQFLTTGTFQKPSDKAFFDHDPTKILYRADGSIAYMPPKPQPKPGDISGWADDQQKVIGDMFAPPPGATAEQVEQAKRAENAFYIMAQENAAGLWGADINVNDYRQMSRSDVALGVARFKGLMDTHSAFDDHWWFGNGVVQFFNGEAKDQEWARDMTNVDEVARRFGVEMPALPVPKSNVDAYRMALAASEDDMDVVKNRIASDLELAEEIQNARTNQGPPPPLVTPGKN